MKSVTVSATLTAGIAILLGLGGCSSSSEVQTSTEVINQGFVSPGKGTAPITMSHYLTAKPAVGAPMALELVFMNDHNSSMRLEISGDNELAVARQVGRSISPGQSVVIELLPQAEGRYYVNVIARLGADDTSQAKIFSIPVQVGAGGVVSTADKASVSPDGERLIRMQAQEKPTD